MTHTEPGVMTVKEWAQELGCTRAWVYQMLKQSGITPTKIGSQWILSPADRALVLARPRKPMGRPKRLTISNTIQ
jgi:excisionase family DNA binding protein